MLAFVGPGRVGWALASASRASGYDVAAVAGGTEVARARLAAAVRARALADPADVEADLIFLTVPDGALAETAAPVRAHSDAWLVHAAGALPASALGVPRAGTFHPLRSFVGEPREVVVAGYGVALEADDEELAGHLGRLAADLGMLPLSVAPADRTRYHAAAVLVGNAPVALLDMARRHFAAINVDPLVAEAALVQLFASVAENAAEQGIQGALSGPVRRGDVTTVERHLAALEAADAVTMDVYRAVALATLELAAELPDGPDAAALGAIRALLTRSRVG